MDSSIGNRLIYFISITYNYFNASGIRNPEGKTRQIQFFDLGGRLTDRLTMTYTYRMYLTFFHGTEIVKIQQVSPWVFLNCAEGNVYLYLVILSISSLGLHLNRNDSTQPTILRKTFEIRLKFNGLYFENEENESL